MTNIQIDQMTDGGRVKEIAVIVHVKEKFSVGGTGAKKAQGSVFVMQTMYLRSK